MSRGVELLEYRHVNDPDGKDVVRYHEFERGVEMYALENGDVLLHHPRKRLWEDR